MCMSGKGGTGGGGWGHPQGDMDMVAVVAGYRNGLVRTGCANSCLGCTNVIRKCYSHLVGTSFRTVKVVWAQNGSLLAVNADVCY